MLRKLLNKRNLLLYIIFLFLIVILVPEPADAKGSFGGSRSLGRSFSRSTHTRTVPPRTSFGGSRKRTTILGRGKSSFGSTRLNSSKAYTSRYGVPRKVVTSRRVKGLPKNYRLMDYGDFRTGLMVGYMTGHTPFLWHTPFHRAFYYTQPYYVKHPDGTMNVYPPTFSFSKVIFMLFVFAGIIFVLYRILIHFKNRSHLAQRSTVHYTSKSSFE